MTKKMQQYQNNSANAVNAEQAPEEALVDVGAAPEETVTETTAAATDTQVSEADKLRAELAEMSDKYLRLNAEFENFRKRSFKEMGTTRVNATAETVTPFLRILDIFNMAADSAQNAANIEAIKQGLQMILTEYSRALEEIGVTKFDAVGQKFDHSKHDAMAQEPSEQPEGTVIKQWSCGYQLGERLLRPARVVVSNGQKA